MVARIEPEIVQQVDPLRPRIEMKSELALDQGKEVTQFQLTVAYRRPDSTAVSRVPLNLSGR